MKEQNLPQGILLRDQQVSFNQLHRRFAETHHGDTLSQNVRFTLFKPDAMAHKQWERVLGADANNLAHLSLSLGMTKSFLTRCAEPDQTWQGMVTDQAVFTPPEQEVLLLTAVVHDWAEGVMGDIPFIHKTKVDEDREMIILRSVVHEVLEDEGIDACEEIATTVMDVLTETDSKLGKAFNAIEKVGYIRTALRAYRQSFAAEDILQKSLEDMAEEVVPRHIQKLMSYAQIYPPVHSYLNYQSQPISEIITKVTQGNPTPHVWFSEFLQIDSDSDLITSSQRSSE